MKSINHDRVALVTGSASGIGLASCLALARNGFTVYASTREPAASEQLAALLSRFSTKHRTLALDVTCPDSANKAVAQIIGDSRRLDVLINNAGYRLEGFLEDTSMEEARDQIETNLIGAIGVTKAVVPVMREQRRGTIVNISCLAGQMASPGASIFCASKFALEGFSRSLRYELRPFGINVTVVVPGPVNTAFSDRNLRIAVGAHAESGPNFEMMRRISFWNDIASRYSSYKVEEIANLIARVAATSAPRSCYYAGTGLRLHRMLRRVLPFRL